DQRRAARGQPRAGPRLRTLQRQEVRVAPDVLRAALDAATEPGDVLGQAAVGVADLERAEAPLADVARVQRIHRLALTTLQVLCCQLKRPPPVRRGEGRDGTPAKSVRNWHRFPLARDGCRGFIGPVPPPLWMRPAMWPITLARGYTPRR